MFIVCLYIRIRYPHRFCDVSEAPASPGSSNDLELKVLPPLMEESEAERQAEMEDELEAQDERRVREGSREEADVSAPRLVTVEIHNECNE